MGICQVPKTFWPFFFLSLQLFPPGGRNRSLLPFTHSLDTRVRIKEIGVRPDDETVSTTTTATTVMRL